MIVVADTSPINYLILIDQITVLEVLFGKIFIPHAVHDELVNSSAPPGVRAWANNPPRWLEVLSPSTRLHPPVAKLDLGEAEAIALAEELQSDWLLIDETAGRTEAARRGLQTIGTLGILREGHKAGLLDLRNAIASLNETGFRVSQSLIQSLLNSI